MIEELVVYVFDRIGHLWKVKNPDGYIHPAQKDVEKVLDKAAVALYDRDVGDTYTTGGLIVEKHQTGLSVYVYVGDYK